MSLILACVTAVLMLAVDQITKYIVMANMELGQTIDFIDGVLNFTYIHNDGGAWGLFGGYRTLLLVVTGVVMLALLFFLIKNHRKSKLFFWSGCLIISGGIGNMLDRIFHGGNVVDFFDVAFIDFPVFNVADCAVVIGVVLLILYFIEDTIKDEKAKKSAAQKSKKEDE